MSMLEKFKAFCGDAMRPNKLQTKSWRECVGKRNGFTDSVASQTCINSYFAGTDHWTGSIRRNCSQSLCDMFRCSLQIIISQVHRLHLGVFFSFLQPFRLLNVFSIYTSVPELSSLQLILAGREEMHSFVLNKVAPYLISLHVFIFYWFYDQGCTD